jgi:hypothetical protein
MGDSGGNVTQLMIGTHRFNLFKIGDGYKYLFAKAGPILYIGSFQGA